MMPNIRHGGWHGPLLDTPVDSTTLHYDVPNDVQWSRVNLEEAMPGVSTPLSWEFHRSSTASVTPGYFALMGLVLERELRRPATTPDQLGAVLFHGRIAINVDLQRRYVARMPGGDPNAFELQILGHVRDVERAEPRERWRLPLVAYRLPANLRRFPSRTETNRSETTAWWRHQIRAMPTASRECAVVAFDDAVRRHVDLVTVHTFGFVVGLAFFTTVTKACAAAGLAGLELELAGSGDGTIETDIVADLERLASGTLSLDAFLDEHGYRGPNEGELSSRTWREDPSPIEHLVRLYASRQAHDPKSVADRFERARTTLLAASPGWRRPLLRWCIDRTTAHMQLREVGKASFVRAKDVARAASRRIGALLVDADQLGAVDDVFFLTRAELETPRGIDLRPAVAERRALRKHYEGLSIPDNFLGTPIATESAKVRASASPPGSIVRGLGASTGVYEGTARVVLDPAELDDFRPGDVLVCELTDPAWAPILELAGAAVIDIGGPLSHGAIVARELGVPAVIGTTDGTQRIPDGARVRVDGTVGEVLLLA